MSHFLVDVFPRGEAFEVSVVSGAPAEMLAALEKTDVEVGEGVVGHFRLSGEDVMDQLTNLAIIGEFVEPAAAPVGDTVDTRPL